MGDNENECALTPLTPYNFLGIRSGYEQVSGQIQYIYIYIYTYIYIYIYKVE